MKLLTKVFNLFLHFSLLKNKLILFYIFTYILISLTLLYCNEKNVHGLSKGLMPINWRTRPESAKECENCHKEIYTEWTASRHKVSFTNELYKESHEREPLTWCVNCHAPLVSGIGERIFSEEGISCIVCHKRNGKILTAHIPTNPKAHEYLEVKEMRRSEFCANCHQFNFPVGTGNVPHKNFKYSDQPMQNTFTEWQMSYFYEKETCQDCHMPTTKQGRKTHMFQGGHNKDFLNKTFSLELESISKTEIKLIVKGSRLGHAFPTGDLFRTLSVRLLDKKGEEVKQILLRYHYEEVEENRDSESLSAKRLKERNIITPPVSKEDAYYMKIVSLSELERKNISSYELSMTYTNEPDDFFSSSINHKERLVFKKEKIQKTNF